MARRYKRKTTDFDINKTIKIDEWIMNGTNFNISVHRHFIVEIFGLAVYLTAFLLGYLITKLF